MIRSDVVVIGGGFAGLVAALASAKCGKSVTLLTYGEGTLTLNSGVIDVLGFDEHHAPVENPLAAIENLPASHPYQKIGTKALEEAVDFFTGVARKNHIPYHGSLDRQMMVPTAVGTLKPTCLAPHSLSGSEVFPGKKKIVVVGIKGLKDFYGDIMMENLKKSLGEDKSYELIEVNTGLTGGRDITTQDVARWMDTDEGTSSFSKQLGKAKSLQSGSTTDVLFVVPQVLGTKGHACYQTISSRVGTDVVETTCLPPSVNGMRLQTLLIDSLRELGVDIVENTKVVRAEKNGAVATAVIAQTASNEKRYYAKKFILATGGFYSGGITMRDFEQPKEVIFDLPVYFVKGEENWSNKELFSDQPQGFAKTGILTDESLRPVDGNGKRVFDNVYVVGRNLGGYDFCFEHSGNGVALASAYKAAMM